MKRTFFIMLGIFALALAGSGLYAQPKITRIPVKAGIPSTFSSYYSKLTVFKSKSGSGSQTITSRTNSLGRSEVVVNASSSGTAVRATGNPTTRNNGGRLCETQGYSMNYLNSAVFNNLERSLPSTIFPGAFLDAQTLLDKRPAAYIAQNRAPLNVSISINDRADIKTFTASNFGSNYEQELHASLRNLSFGTNIPASMIMQITEITSSTELQASLNLTVGLMLPLEEFGIPAEISQGISGSASASTTKKLRTYIITYEQPMYDYTIKENDRNLFFTNAGLAGQHTNAALVRSVIYGRRIMMVVKSEEDAATVSATVRQRLGLNVTGGDLAGFTVGSRVDGSIITKFNQQIKSFNAIVQGGNAALANQLLSDPAAIKDYIEDRNAAVLRANTGEVPIQYVLERVSADVVLGVRSTANFQSESCLVPTYKVELVYKGIKCYKVVEAPLDDMEDIFGTCTVNGKQIINVGESNAISIAANKTSADLKNVVIEPAISFDRIPDFVLTFSPSLKDWEPLHKPAYKLAQPLDGKYQITNTRLNKIIGLQSGQSVTLDGGNEEIKVFENGGRNNSSVAVLFQVKVTRN